jgi:hypothetical protein
MPEIFLNLQVLLDLEFIIMTNVTLTADFGASLCRAIYTIDGTSQPQLLLLAPEIASVPSASIHNYEQYKVSVSYPENSAWLMVNDTYYVLGALAHDRFRVEPCLKEIKSNSAWYQILALVGCIAQRHKLTPNFSLNLAILLPYDEFNVRDRFGERLEQLLADFTFRGEKFSVSLARFLCYPEGSGIFLRGRTASKKKPNNPKEITIAVIMMGYRNTSLLVFDRGELKIAKTNLQGFEQMVESVKAQVPGQTSERLNRAICQARTKKGKRAYQEISRLKELEWREKEVAVLERAVLQAREEYLRIVLDFLGQNLAQWECLDEFIVSGGTALYLKKELTEHLRTYPGATINWCDSLEQRVQQVFPEAYAKNSLKSRLCDVYGLFYKVLNQPLPRLNQAA